jgi:hypothetical protein
MTTDMRENIRASRRRVPRSRGALSGFLLLFLGAWAALIPMIGPYFDVAYTPRPNDAWHWTAARGWLEVLPGATVFLGGLLLLISASRMTTVLGGWLAALGGAWLIVGPPLAAALTLSLGRPEPSTGTNHQAFDAVVMFYGVGAVIVFLAALGLGRLSVVTVRDVRAAERRRAAEEEAASTQSANYPPAPPADARTDDQTAEAAGRHSVPAGTDGSQTTTVGQRPAGDQPGYGQQATGQSSSYAQTAPPTSEER